MVRPNSRVRETFSLLLQTIKCFSAAMEEKRIRLIPEHLNAKLKCIKKSMFHHTSVRWDAEMREQHWDLSSSVGSNAKLHQIKVRALIFLQCKIFQHSGISEWNFELSLHSKSVKIFSWVKKKIKKKIICVSVCFSSPRNSRFYNLLKKLYVVEISPSVLWHNIFYFYVLITLYNFAWSKSEKCQFMGIHVSR